MSESTSNFLVVDLTDQTAIVTGASQGIGKAIALALGSNGAKVCCVARNAERLAETVATIEAAGGQAMAISCDVTSKESVESVVETVNEKWEKIDILVNNAGVTRDKLLVGMSDEEWDQVIETNLKGTFLFTRAVAKLMRRKRSGRIINISSVSGLIGNPGQANYSASKAGVIGFTRTASKELAGKKVLVNAICPGFIESDMTKKLGEVVLGEVQKHIPMKRIGQAEEVADAVLFLVSKHASYITGQVLTVDGGMTV